jgi:RNA polymerase sigma-70 factor (ECF subfamily)
MAFFAALGSTFPFSLTPPRTRQSNSWMEDSDGAAIKQAQAGSTDAFRALVERHSRAVFRLAYRMTGHEQDAEDTVQETFLRAWRQLQRFDGRARFSTWLYTIATNCALDLVRARKRRGETTGEAREDGGEAFATVATSAPSPERLAASGQIAHRVRAALNDLSDAERAAFLLRHFEGVPTSEISRALGCSDASARQSVFRAVQKMRLALEPAAGRRV